MAKKKHRFWNVMIVLTVVICLAAFAVHFKNWTKIEQDHVKIISGFYYKNLRFSEIDSVELIDKIPPMIRLNGFSALEKEKGLFREFKDSLTDKKIHVYVDNLASQKIKVIYNDSSKLYLNYVDSLQTLKLYRFLEGKIQATD